MSDSDKFAERMRTVPMLADYEPPVRVVIDDAFTPAAIDQAARDQERFDAGYKAGYEAAQREWMRMQEGEECKPPERNADGLRIVWDWSPWLRFLAARAALIHEALGEGKSVAYIRDWLSMDEGQVRLIGATELRSIPGTPGAVWPPNEFQELGRQVKDPK